MVPGARFVDCRRDPVETCLSCYRQWFGHGQGFTYDLDAMAAYWHDYLRLIASLEGAVARSHPPAAKIRGVACRSGSSGTSRCWQRAGCVRSRLHELPRNERPVRTASAAQVRQPLRRDTARADRFGALLDPLRAALGVAHTDGRASAAGGIHRSRRSLGSNAAQRMQSAKRSLAFSGVERSKNLTGCWRSIGFCTSRSSSALVSFHRDASMSGTERLQLESSIWAVRRSHNDSAKSPGRTPRRPTRYHRRCANGSSNASDQAIPRQRMRPAERIEGLSPVAAKILRQAASALDAAVRPGCTRADRSSGACAAAPRSHAVARRAAVPEPATR